MQKFWLCDAPTALIEATGHLDDILQSIRQMAKLGYHAGIGLLDLGTDRLRRQVETESRDLDPLSDAIDLSLPPDKIAHSVGFACRDSRNDRVTTIQIQLENAYCFLDSYIDANPRPLVTLDKREIHHVSYLNRKSDLSRHYKSPAAATRIFWAYCKQGFAEALTQPGVGIKIFGKPRGGKDSERIPNDFFGDEICDVFDEISLAAISPTATLKIDWLHSRIGYNRQIWNEVYLYVSDSFFPGERIKRRNRVERCVDLIISNDIIGAYATSRLEKAFAACRQLILHLRWSEFLDARQAAARMRRLAKRRARADEPRPLGGR